MPPHRLAFRRRQHAAQYEVNPNRIGVMGSSAGGHLAACAATLFDHPVGKTGDALDAVSGRPDFLIMLYPVISSTAPATHVPSRESLLGPNASEDQVELMSVEKQVTPQSPPTLMFHTSGDVRVPAENSILFYQALARNKVPAELHIFEKGGHGAGLRDGLGTTSLWPKRAEEWLRERKLVP
jgi:acetyl esterase/lipase